MHNYVFCLIVIINMWVTPWIYFHPTAPLPHMVPLRFLEPIVPSTSSVCPWAIISHDIEPVTHGKKTSQYIHVWAIYQRLRMLEDTTDKVKNNFKSLLDADGGVLWVFFQLKWTWSLSHFLKWGCAEMYCKPILEFIFTDKYYYTF